MENPAHSPAQTARVVEFTDCICRERINKFKKLKFKFKKKQINK